MKRIATLKNPGGSLMARRWPQQLNVPPRGEGHATFVPASAVPRGPEHFSPFENGGRRGIFRAVAGVAAASCWLFLSLGMGCGYHLLGAGGALPPGVKTVAIPPFERQVPVLELDQRVTEAVRRELARRAKVRVQAGKEGADAVLSGAVTQYSVVPLSYDSSGRANRYQVTMAARIRLASASGEVLYESDGYRFTESYERAPGPGLYTDREPVAYGSVARDFAVSLVSRLLEGDPGASPPPPQAVPPAGGDVPR